MRNALTSLALARMGALVGLPALVARMRSWRAWFSDGSREQTSRTGSFRRCRASSPQRSLIIAVGGSALGRASGAGLALASLFVVPVLNRLRVTPSMSSSLIRRATRFRLTRTPQPVVVSAGGETQHPAHGRKRKGGPVRLHERISPPGIDPLSLANQAAAFFRMSRSILSRLTSRFSSLISLRASVVSPSLRRPSSRSACSQFRIVCADGSNSRAKDPGLRPALASSTIRSLYTRADTALGFFPP